MQLGTINHSEPIVDRKVKHFYDHLKYLASLNREWVLYPLENHLTLLERIRFKLNLPVLYPSSVRVIENILISSSLFHTKNDLFSKELEVSDLVKILKKASSKTTINDNFKATFLALIVSLNGDDGLKGDKYFLSILRKLIKCLNSRKGIKAEKSKIEYLATLLLSEFLRTGFHLEDITGFGGLLKRILSKRIEVYDENNESSLHSTFPLPFHIESQREKEGFKKIVEEFINNRTFAQQFEGLYNQFRIEKDGQFLFKIKNVANETSDFHFRHHEVEIFHHKQLIIDKTTWEVGDIEFFDRFIEEKNTILASISLKYKSHKLATQLAVLKIREAIDFLNFVSKDKKKNYNGAILGTDQSYLIFKGGESVRWFMQHDKVMALNSSIQPTADYLYPDGFKRLNSSIQKVFLRNDKVLFRASTTNYWDEKVSCYWRFFDSIIGYSISEIKGGDIIKKASKIILLTEEKIRKRKHRYTITNALHNSSSEMINLKIPPAHLAEKIEQSSDDEKKFLELEEEADYPFINEKFKEYKEMKMDYSKTHDFYRILFWETYEQRNIAFHQNDFCFSTVEKLVKILPSVMLRVRESIITELISNKNLSIQEAIDNLSKRGSDLLTQ